MKLGTHRAFCGSLVTSPMSIDGGQTMHCEDRFKCIETASFFNVCSRGRLCETGFLSVSSTLAKHASCWLHGLRNVQFQVQEQYALGLVVMFNRMILQHCDTVVLLRRLCCLECRPAYPGPSQVRRSHLHDVLLKQSSSDLWQRLRLSLNVVI